MAKDAPENLKPCLPDKFTPNYDDICPYKLKAAKKLISEGLVNEDEPHALIYDYTRLQANIEKLVKAFPEGTHHALAVKSNNAVPVMTKIHQCGMTFEAASFGEFTLSELSTTKKENIVYDSPTKLEGELKKAFEIGAYVNLDNFQEFERVKKLLADPTKYPKAKNIGFRVNPQVGEGSTAAVSTATKFSKFGMAYNDYEQQLLEAYTDPSSPEWLNGIHLHVGSQYVHPSMIILGV